MAIISDTVFRNDMNTKSVANEILTFATVNNVGIMDSALHYASRANVELETIGNIILKSPALMEKITIEAENLNFIPKTSRLPLGFLCANVA